jgi:hypothetical protein
MSLISNNSSGGGGLLFLLNLLMIVIVIIISIIGVHDCSFIIFDAAWFLLVICVLCVSAKIGGPFQFSVAAESSTLT